jgi:hypothetical protein
MMPSEACSDLTENLASRGELVLWLRLTKDVTRAAVVVAWVFSTGRLDSDF